jgi:Membrane proteins related to metalloendopeptidases
MRSRLPSVKWTISVFVTVSLLPQFASALIWPTPNPAFQNGEPIDRFIQPTVSGVPESGLFGCVRNDGHKFHEGLDLFPLKRSKSGEAADPVYAVLPGRVVHVNSTAGYSSYGRYIVIQHDGEVPAFHTLYAHLAKVDDAIRPGVRVQTGTILGVMGRSAAGYSIPKTRAHLHFEIGFRLSDHFQDWYDNQKFGSANHHGNWNGMNMVGLNPLDYYQSVRLGRVTNLYEYLKQLPAVARIRIYTSQVPDFVGLYPSLVTRPYAGQKLVAWDIAFSEFGVPKEWTPRFAGEAGLSGQPGNVQVIAYDPTILEAQTCRQVLSMNGAQPGISGGTLTTLKKLFGFK